MILYKNFVLYVFAFILTFYVTTKSLIPNAGFALVAMVWLMANTIFFIYNRYSLYDSISIIFFLVYLTLIYFFNLNERFSTPAYIHILGSIVFYLILVNFIDSYEQLSKMLLIHIIVVVPILIHMAYISWFQLNSFWLTPDFESGTRFGKNSVGMFIIFCFTYLYGYYRNNNSFFVKVALLFLVFCALYTISRGTLVSLSICIIMFLFISSKKITYVKPILFSMLLFFLAKNILSFDLFDNMMQIKNVGGTHKQEKFIDFTSSGPGSKYGYGQRASHYITIVKKFPNKPIFGHGTESFRRNEGTLAHNDYITILYEYGLVGFLLFIFILFNHFFKLWKIRDKIPNRYVWIGEAQLVQFFIMAFVSLIMTTYISPIFWYHLAISATLVKITKHHVDQKNLSILQ